MLAQMRRAVGVEDELKDTLAAIEASEKARELCATSSGAAEAAAVHLSGLVGNFCARAGEDSEGRPEAGLRLLGEALDVAAVEHGADPDGGHDLVVGESVITC